MGILDKLTSRTPPKPPPPPPGTPAQPDVELERDGQRRPVTARVATATERERLWPRLVAMYPSYDVYQSRTDRVIPVILCAPRSP